MNKLSKKEGVAVFVGIGVLAYLFFTGPIMSLFSVPSGDAGLTNNTQMNQDGFVAQDITVGSGQLAEAGDKIAAHYVGTLVNGQVFDSSRDRGTPIEFMLGVGQVIRGWDEGLVGMRVGGKRVLTISPEYAYGPNAVGSIPANSTLVFEVELMSVEKGQ